MDERRTLDANRLIWLVDGLKKDMEDAAAREADGPVKVLREGCAAMLRMLLAVVEGMAGEDNGDPCGLPAEDDGDQAERSEDNPSAPSGQLPLYKGGSGGEPEGLTAEDVNFVARAKSGLRHCIGKDCDGCPYRPNRCEQELHRDALGAILHLEGRNRELAEMYRKLHTEYGQLFRETEQLEKQHSGADPAAAAEAESMTAEQAASWQQVGKALCLPENATFPEILQAARQVKWERDVAMGDLRTVFSPGENLCSICGVRQDGCLNACGRLKRWRGGP